MHSVAGFSFLWTGEKAVVATLPGGNNTFVLDHKASGGLTVDFSRNPSKFALNQYTKLIPAPKMAGYWLEMTVEEAGRVLSANDVEHAWPDGADAPDDNGGTESFQFKQFTCDRKAWSARLGNLGAEQASWDIVNQHARIKAQQGMTSRTRHVIDMLTTTGNYLSGHYSAAADISGNSGTWAASTSARQDIKRSLNYAAKVIEKATLSAVSKKDLVLVISPDCASEISECQEIVEYLKGSQHSKGQIEGTLWDNSEWGLPPYLYGVKLVVENTTMVTSKKGASSVSRSYVLTGAKAMLLARPGALEGLYGSPEFSSCSLFVYQGSDGYDMQTEVKNDTENRVTKVRVIDHRVAKLTAPASSFLFTDVI
jgi:hypothetical protein